MAARRRRAAPGEIPSASNLEPRATAASCATFPFPPKRTFSRLSSLRRARSALGCVRRVRDIGCGVTYRMSDGPMLRCRHPVNATASVRNDTRRKTDPPRACRVRCAKKE